MSKSSEYRRTEWLFIRSMTPARDRLWGRSSAGSRSTIGVVNSPIEQATTAWIRLGAYWLSLTFFLGLIWFGFSGAVRAHVEIAAAESESPSSTADVSCSLYSSLLRPGDEFWVVSTRHLDCPRQCEDFQPTVRQLGPAGWSDSSPTQLANASPMATVVYVHGNRFTYADAVQKGRRVYQVLGRDAERPAMRFIIWSWPSERVRGPFRDARMKAERADIEGYYVACFITGLPAETPLSFVGHSFGARVVGGALQALGTGRLLGIPLEEERLSQLPLIRVAFLAAAIDGDIFLPGREYAEALSLVDQLLVLYNPHDPVLKYYALLDRYRRPRALGAAGMPRIVSSSGMVADVRQRNVAAIIRHSHDDDRYFSSPTLMSEVRRTLLGHLLTDELVDNLSHLNTPRVQPVESDMRDPSP